MARCSTCRTLIAEGDEVVTCPECVQIYHGTCWRELGGCATYGCGEAATSEKPEPVATGSGWGDAKDCPECGREISSHVLVCRCGAKFPSADPMTRAEYGAWRERKTLLRSTRRLLVLLFIFSLIGVTAPFLGFIAGCIAYTRRHGLAGSDGTYLAIGYGTAALGGVYTLTLLLLLAGL